MIFGICVQFLEWNHWSNSSTETCLQLVRDKSESILSLFITVSVVEERSMINTTLIKMIENKRKINDLLLVAPKNTDVYHWYHHVNKSIFTTIDHIIAVYDKRLRVVKVVDR
jgi:hypothetical protein